ncbi:MAG: aminoglycoside phosphotransferase family protein [Sporichthyaceae bacterium]
MRTAGDALSAYAADLLGEWTLTADGAPVRRPHSFCLDVRTETGRAAFLKVREPDGSLAHLALRHWNGHGAANLLRADPHRGALLLERVGPQDLTSVWDLTACEAIGELYGRLHVPAPPQLARLPDLVRERAEVLRALPRHGPVPRRVVEQALALGEDLADDPASVGTLLHADLHHGTVLAAGRDWAAIAPRPLSGDPHWEPAPTLIAHWSEVAEDVRFGVRRRFDALVEVAGLDPDRARDWTIVRLAHLAAEPAPDRDLPTRCIAAIKAVQD